MSDAPDDDREVAEAKPARKRPARRVSKVIKDKEVPVAEAAPAVEPLVVESAAAEPVVEAVVEAVVEPAAPTRVSGRVVRESAVVERAVVPAAEKEEEDGDEEELEDEDEEGDDDDFGSAAVETAGGVVPNASKKRRRRKKKPGQGGQGGYAEGPSIPVVRESSFSGSPRHESRGEGRQDSRHESRGERGERGERGDGRQGRQDSRGGDGRHDFRGERGEGRHEGRQDFRGERGERNERGERGEGRHDSREARQEARNEEAGEGVAPVTPSRSRVNPEELAKKAWKIFLAEVSEEGLALIHDNDARELSRRSFRLAEIFLEEAGRRASR